MFAFLKSLFKSAETPATLEVERNPRPALFGAETRYIYRDVSTPMNEVEGFASFVWSSIDRHMHGEWGCVTASVSASNDMALANGGQLVSVYRIPFKGIGNGLLEICTDSHRKVTCARLL